MRSEWRFLTHNRCPSDRPFRTVLKRRPYIMRIVRLGTIDRADWKPDNEDKNHHYIPYRTNDIDPPDELGALHRDQALCDQNQQEDEVDMPILITQSVLPFIAHPPTNLLLEHNLHSKSGPLSRS